LVIRAGLLALAVIAGSAAADAQTVTRIDPPHWWIGFEDPRVQLVIYGEDIAGLTASIDHPGVEIRQSAQTGNANYLFLDIEIAADAVAGPAPIRLAGADGAAADFAWELRERAARSAGRRGFDSTDTVYLVYPDRFANGDPDNDSQPGYVDGLARDDPGGRHGGDLQGLIDRLGYISDMGFTQIWLNPVLENAEDRNSYHGYAITDHYRVDPRLGSNALYREFSAAARARGIGLIQDVVLNHAGSHHYLFTDPPDPSWFNNDSVFEPSTHQHTTVHDPYAAIIDRADFTDGWFAPTMPDFNQREPRVARYLIDNTIWWIEEAGLSGLRLDTYDFADAGFLDAMMARLHLEYPELGVVGEAWAYDPAVIAPMQSGSPLAPEGQPGVSSLMDFPLQIRARDALLAPDSWDDGLISLYQFMVNDRLYGDPHNMMVFADNHDFDRIHTQMGGDIALTRMALAWVMTTRGIPQILYGTELLFTNETPGDHGQIRADFPDWLRRIVTWRRDTAAIHHGDMLHFVPHDRHGTQSVYVYARRHEGETVLVAINKGETPHALDLDRYAEAIAGYAAYRDVMTGETAQTGDGIDIPART
ncbi:Neopullulanase SusA (Starch-utilization system protein A), partial [Durusdinium trenchii]